MFLTVIATLTTAGLTGAAVTGPRVTASYHVEFEANPRPHSQAVDWIDAMLLAIESNPPSPTVTTWRMWIVTSSMYDASAAFTPTAIGTVSGDDLRQPVRLRTDANRARAVSYAAHHALTFVFPAQSAIFDSVLDLHGYPVDDSSDLPSPAAIGRTAADRVIAHRLSDGSNARNAFTDVTSARYPTLYEPRNTADPSATSSREGVTFDPNRWTPLRVPTGTRSDAYGNPVSDDVDPDSYRDQRFLTPHWGAVEPFGLTSGDQFRPPPPPQLGSNEPYVDAVGVVSSNDEAYREQAAELVAISGMLDDGGRVSAEFWADGPHTWTPPGHWMQLAIGVSLRDRHTLDEDVRMFMALSGGLLDAGIAAWDAKREFDYVRPASAIPHLYRGQDIRAWAGPNRGIQIIDGAHWLPFQSLTFVTPPFAEYVSGHSTFSRTAAEILTMFTRSPRMFDGTTGLGRDYDGDDDEDLLGRHVGIPGSLATEVGPGSTVVLLWDTFYDAADEAGYSRRYGGIHFRDGDLRGREMGAEIGMQAFERAELWWDPFHVLIETTIEAWNHDVLAAGTARRLVLEFHRAEVHFNAGADRLGCRQLSTSIERLEQIDPADDRLDALSRQVDAVHDAMCP